MSQLAQLAQTVAPAEVPRAIPPELSEGFNPHALLNTDAQLRGEGSLVQKSVQDPLSELILSGRVKDGEKVVISADKQGLAFNGKLAAAA